MKFLNSFKKMLVFYFSENGIAEHTTAFDIFFP